MNIKSMLILGLISLLGFFGAIGCAAEVEPASTARVASVAHAPDDAAAAPAWYVINEAGTLVGTKDSKPVAKTDAEWKEELTASQFRILRESGTERSGTGSLLKNKQPGVYTCGGCGLPLFDASSKFKSGTGWPSFYESIAKGNVTEKVDRAFGTIRTEINCSRCDGHLGHVFNDGPRPTGLRYCVNSESLAFTAASDLASLADPSASKGADVTSNTKILVVAGGCFWCVEAVFEELEGVIEAVSGYSGGSVKDADYRKVCSGKTGHAEAVQIVYDPKRISYEDLLRVHFATHDPTQLNRQGNDVGPQYRSTVFYADKEERALAEAFIEDLNEQNVYKRPIVTTLERLTKFYSAEPNHQNYVCLNPNQGYVRSVALPKVEKVRKLFKDKLKDK